MSLYVSLRRDTSRTLLVTRADSGTARQFYLNFRFENLKQTSESANRSERHQECSDSEPATWNHIANHLELDKFAIIIASVSHKFVAGMFGILWFVNEIIKLILKSCRSEFLVSGSKP